ncbi:uncharacterized protein BDR25DRAFT_64472 [Lindgomyces ingoldianus]|uniref:Uncharacterized protein n=1 Tax=Lindgomyces ingoldianus TaxID=673940 RepID=A0ACB6RAE4_9PLEO|nr:uncharacterized protein BDR25DRAFT_64472 [Lindgomyces ingoldianus]KAF2476214.1 hypothetical protein BDR25DRAFT_64472 [Lindgomyces ingoldianus]
MYVFPSFSLYEWISLCIQALHSAPSFHLNPERTNAKSTKPKHRIHEQWCEGVLRATLPSHIRIRTNKTPINDNDKDKDNNAASQMHLHPHAHPPNLQTPRQSIFVDA